MKIIMDIKDFWNDKFLPKESPTSNDLLDMQNFIQKQRGWIYIMCNSKYPELVKIGMTRKKNVFEREKSINNTGVIDHWKIQYADPVYWATHVETTIHKALKSHEFKKEYFKISLEEAILYVEHAIQIETRNLGRFINLELIDTPLFSTEGFYLDEWINSSLDF